MTAIASNRRRMTLVSRPRTISCGLGRNHIGKHTDLHKLHPSHPPHKSFAELFQKRPFPRSLNYIPQSLPVEGGWLRPAARERSSQGTDRSHWEAHGLAQTISISIPLIKVLRSFSKSDRSPRSSKLYPAISPRRRRMAPSSRSRTIYVGNGRNHIGKHTDLHKLYPVPSPS